MGPGRPGRGGLQLLLFTYRAEASSVIDEAQRLTAADALISGPVVITALEAIAWLTLMSVLSLEYLEDAAEDAHGLSPRSVRMYPHSVSAPCQSMISLETPVIERPSSATALAFNALMKSVLDELFIFGSGVSGNTAWISIRVPLGDLTPRILRSTVSLSGGSVDQAISAEVFGKCQKHSRRPKVVGWAAPPDFTLFPLVIC